MTPYLAPSESGIGGPSAMAIGDAFATPLRRPPHWFRLQCAASAAEQRVREPFRVRGMILCACVSERDVAERCIAFQAFECESVADWPGG